MARKVAKEKHDRVALDVVYDVDSKKYKLVTVKYALDEDSAYIHSLEDLSESMAVSIMKLNMMNDRKVQDAIKVSKERAKQKEKLNKDEGEDII